MVVTRCQIIGLCQCPTVVVLDLMSFTENKGFTIMMNPLPPQTCCVCNVSAQVAQLINMICGHRVCIGCATTAGYRTVVDQNPWGCPSCTNRAPASYEVYDKPGRNLLVDRERRVVKLTCWSMYRIKDFRLRGIVSDEVSYGELPDYLGFIQRSNDAFVLLPPVVVQHLEDWWYARPGGKVKESYIHSVIFAKQVLSTVDVTPLQHSFILKYATLYAYYLHSDIRPVLAMNHVSWRTLFIRHHKKVALTIGVSVFAYKCYRVVKSVNDSIKEALSTEEIETIDYNSPVIGPNGVMGFGSKTQTVQGPLASWLRRYNLI